MKFVLPHFLVLGALVLSQNASAFEYIVTYKDRTETQSLVLDEATNSLRCPEGFKITKQGYSDKMICQKTVAAKAPETFEFKDYKQLKVENYKAKLCNIETLNKTTGLYRECQCEGKDVYANDTGYCVIQKTAVQVSIPMYSCDNSLKGIFQSLKSMAEKEVLTYKLNQPGATMAMCGAEVGTVDIEILEPTVYVGLYDELQFYANIRALSRKHPEAKSFEHIPVSIPLGRDRTTEVL